VTLKGSGVDKTTIKSSRNTIIGADNSLVTGFTLSGVNATYSDDYIVNCENGSSPTIMNNVLRDARYEAIACHNDAYAVIVNNIFIDNGAGIDNYRSSPTIINNTFVGHLLFAIRCQYLAFPTIINNIITDTQGCGIEGASGGGLESKIGYNNVWNNNANYCGVSPGEGEISVDPLFVNPETDDFHLTSSSPCIDTGTSEDAPNHDIEGDDRPQGLGYDIGADEFVPSYIEVDIDIKPGSYPNSINLKSKGKVPVAILTTDDFDAYDVDPDTCVFANANPLRWRMEDVDNDGDQDMILHFMTQELDLTEESTEATLEGETFEGMQITGTDSVNIVPKGNMHSKKAKKKKKK
jgi:vacuolar-type H+-ATPase subunit F/Vma7